MALMLIVFAPLSGRIVGARGARLPLVIAGTFIAIGALLLTGIDRQTSYVYLVFCYLVFAFGFGFVNPPITNTAVSGMPRDQAGVASAFASTSRQTGGALGIAVIGAVINIGGGASAAAGIEKSGSTGWLLIAGAGTAIAVLGLVATTPWAQRTAARAAESFSDEDTPEAAL